VGRVYQKTFVDTYSKVGFTKLYDDRLAADASEPVAEPMSDPIGLH
jgi:hypothetical protein